MCECILRFDAARLQESIVAMLEVGCRLLLIAGCRETLRLRGYSCGCNEHRRRRMVRQQPTRVRCPSRLRERRDCSQSLFFKFSWASGMLPGLTTLNLKVKFSERLSEDLQKLFLQQRFLLGGGRSVSESDGDVDGGAFTAAVLKVGMRPGPHRTVQRDASAKRPRSRVQRASEAPDG